MATLKKITNCKTYKIILLLHSDGLVKLSLQPKKGVILGSYKIREIRNSYKDKIIKHNNMSIKLNLKRYNLGQPDNNLIYVESVGYWSYV